MSKTVVLCVILLIFSKLSSGQAPWHIKGRVVNEQQAPLTGATVTLFDPDGKVILKTLTDGPGHFELSLPVTGTGKLVVSFTGFNEYRSQLFSLADKDFGTIKLVPGARALQAVTVVAKKDLIELDGNSMIYNVSKSIDAQGVSAFDALRKAPGVYIDNDRSISLNGKTGVMILIDGRQTYLSGRELIDLLKSMPSSGIKAFEIITSPSAKYDAAGAAGMINIKTNKSLVKGFNGTLTSGLTYGMSVKHVQDLSFNYRKNNFNIYGSYNHFLGYRYYLYGTDRFQEGKTYDSNTDDTDKRKNIGTRLGFDYTINKKNTIGVLLNGGFIFGAGLTKTKTSIGQATSSQINEVLDAVNDYYYQQTNRYNLNLNYKYEDSLGRIVNFDVDFGSFDKGNANLQSNSYSNNQSVITSQNLYRSLNNIDINLKAFKLDYTANVFKGQLDIGAKYSDISSENSAKFYHEVNQVDSLDDRRSNTFKFTEQITSGYVNYKKNAGKWVFQAGLRMENSASDGALNFRSNGVDSLKHIKRNYTNLFPSFSISVKANSNNGFSLGYSRRIDRPAYQDLNPFIYLLDELSFWQGNPFLQPQLTQRINLQYAYKSSTILGLTYAYTDQYSTRITDTLAGSKIVMIPRNLGIQKNLSLSLTQNLSPQKWWDISFNGTVYTIRNQIAFDRFRNFDLKQLAGRMNLQQTFKLPYKFTGELSGAMISKRLVGANEFSKGTNQVDIGLQRKFMKDRTTVRLVFNDIYKGAQARSSQNYNDFYLRSYGYYESRQVRINVTYKFADATVKGPRSRSSALENENSRAK